MVWVVWAVWVSKWKYVAWRLRLSGGDDGFDLFSPPKYRRQTDALAPISPSLSLRTCLRRKHTLAWVPCTGVALLQHQDMLLEIGGKKDNNLGTGQKRFALWEGSPNFADTCNMNSLGHAVRRTHGLKKSTSTPSIRYDTSGSGSHAIPKTINTTKHLCEYQRHCCGLLTCICIPSPRPHRHALFTRS